MKRFFHVTYDVVTNESAERGDTAENGFMLPGCWRHKIETIGVDDVPSLAMTLRDAMRLIGCCEDSGRWFTETDGRNDYRTGDVETRSLHPPENVTPASYGRLRRLVCR